MRALQRHPTRPSSAGCWNLRLLFVFALFHFALYCYPSLQIAARDHGRAGNKESATYCLRVARELTNVLAEVRQGRAFDMSKLPPSPQVQKKKKKKKKRDAKRKRKNKKTATTTTMKKKEEREDGRRSLQQSKANN